MTPPILITADGFAGTTEPRITAMVVRDGVIEAVGDADTLCAQWPHAAVTDYGSACVLPGFNDCHMHLGMMVSQSMGVDLSPERTPDRADLAARLSAADPDSRGWVRASRYDHTRTTDGVLLTRADLDDLVPDAPAVVGHISAHWGVVNSAALNRAGITEDTPDPDGGAYGREADGCLTGQVSEQAFFDFVYPSLSRNLDLTPDISGEEALNVLRANAETLLAAGITSIGDAMMGPQELRLFQRARNRDALPVRVNALMTFPHLPALRAVGIADGFGDEWLRIGGIKAFVDGAVAGRSCAVAEPFEGSDDRGVMVTDLASITDLAADCAEAGMTLAIHANGERAIGLVLDAVESLAAQGRPTPRLRIEHCSVITDEILTRMRELDAGAAPFAGYPYYHGDKLLQWYGEERVERMFAHRSFLDVGITIGGSSDYPCGPLSPLAGIQSCVTRTSASGMPVGVGQRITVEEALDVYTHGSARLEGRNDVKGRLQPGHLADFTILQTDPRTVDPSTIAQIPVIATWVAGVKKWERNPQ